MAKTYILKNSDVLVEGNDYDYHFPITNPENLILPVIAKNHIWWAVFFLLTSLVMAFMLAEIICSFFLPKQYIIFVSLVVTLIVGFFRGRYLFFHNELVISRDGVQLPIGSSSKIMNLSYSQIYDIHFNRISRYRGVDYIIYIQYLEDVADYKTHNHIIFGLMDEGYALKMTAIARTAMLNYHQKHHITNLPKVQFIQQK